jgi:hypothetical protein
MVEEEPTRSVPRIFIILISASGLFPDVHRMWRETKFLAHMGQSIVCIWSLSTVRHVFAFLTLAQGNIKSITIGLCIDVICVEMIRRISTGCASIREDVCLFSNRSAKSGGAEKLCRNFRGIITFGIFNRGISL